MKPRESEWVWLIVESADNDRRLIFDHLDGDPIAIPKLRLGMELAISYDLVEIQARSTGT